ncbi:MAG: hypothetical protein ACYDCO_17600 [Armatimonadota bacterium]
MRLLLALCLFFCTVHAMATTIRAMSWEELVLSCDFLGVVTCVTAGGNVARYRVEERWKGTAPDTVLIEMNPNYFGQQYQVVLVGQRFLVAAFRSDPPSSNSFGIFYYGLDQVPLWWRSIPTDFYTLLAQGMEELPADPTSPVSLFLEDWPNLATFHKVARKFLAAPPAEQERRLLQRATEDNLRWKWRDKEMPPTMSAMLKKVQKAKTVDAVLSALMAGYRATSETDMPESLPEILRIGGRQRTLAYLEKLPAAQWPPSRYTRDEMLDEVRDQLGLLPPKEPKEQEEARPTEEELAGYRTALREQPIRGWPLLAYPALCRKDPAFVASWLANWHNTVKDRWDVERPYQLATMFAIFCPTNRAACFRQMLSAHEPFVRVTGAVYLCFEDHDAGMAALKELSVLEGDAGVWAALTLARRGDRSAVPRALQVFAPVSDYDRIMRSNAHNILQDRVMELFSNAAAQANITLPALPDDSGNNTYQARANALHQCYLRWWEQHAERLDVRDPWMAYLEKQKID